MKKVWEFILKHKVWSSVTVVVVSVCGYWAYNSFADNADQEVHYVLAAVEKGTLINSVSGSGQISVSNQVDVKPKASGKLTYLNAKIGQEVKAGTLIAQVNASDAYKSIRDARISLESAQISLKKAQESSATKPSELSILQAEDAVTQAQESKKNAEDNLQSAYENGYNTVSSVFLDLPAIMTGLNDIISGTSINGNQANLNYYFDAANAIDVAAYQYKASAENDYATARAAYDRNFNDYKLTSRSSDATTIENLIVESYDTTRKISQAIKSMNNLIQFYKDKLTNRDLKPVALAETHLSSLSSYTSKTNSELSSLSSSKQSIQSAKNAIVSATRTIEQKTVALADLNKAPDPIDPLDLRSQELNVQQRRNALYDAQSKLADYSVRAPFAGVFAGVAVVRGDEVSSGTILATLITKQKIAEISLNEIDVAKVQVGQKVTLTFDAISDLSITGTVGEIDALGTVSQGVVTYNVKIAFDTQDDRIKSGMSVSASIMIEAKQDVLLVPSSAVKTLGNTSYIETLEGVADQALATSGTGITSVVPPKQVAVELGSMNDSMTEITSGLKKGDLIIVRTINPTATTSTTQGTSLLQMGGNRNTGGGATRMPDGGGFGR